MYSRIKISVPSEFRHTAFEDIPLLAPGQEIRIPTEIVLQGSAGTVMFMFMFILYLFCSSLLYLEYLEYLVPDLKFVVMHLILCLFARLILSDSLHYNECYNN